MKAKVLIGVLASLVFAGGASGAILIQDDFDSYADQAAMNAVWGIRTEGGWPGPAEQPAMLIQGDDHTTGTTNSVLSTQTTGVDQSRQYFAAPNVTGTDANPLKWQFWMKATPADGTGGFRSHNELRGYDSDIIGTGGLTGLLAMGMWRDGTPSMNNVWSARIVGGGGVDYLALTNPLTEGWHKLTAILDSDSVDFYVDDVYGGSSPMAGVSFDAMLLGSLYSSTAGYTLTDDVLVEIVPEPATLALLGLGGLFLRRRRA